MVLIPSRIDTRLRVVRVVAQYGIGFPRENRRNQPFPSGGSSSSFLFRTHRRFPVGGVPISPLPYRRASSLVLFRNGLRPRMPDNRSLSPAPTTCPFRTSYRRCASLPGAYRCIVVFLYSFLARTFCRFRIFSVYGYWIFSFEDAGIPSLRLGNG